jgi:predicted ATPase
MPKNNWYVITGGPSVGKSTLLTELRKLGYTTFPETARVVIDDALAKGQTVRELRADERRFQLEVLERKVQLEAEQTPADVIFYDRGMQDTLAFLRLRDIAIDPTVEKAMRAASYKHVFLLEPLENYTIDYARVETREESLKLNQLLAEAYGEYGMQPITVPPLRPAERAQFVLDKIKAGQPA